MVNILVWIAIAAMIGYFLWSTIGLVTLGLTVGMNNRGVASEAFSTLLSEAEKTMMIYDDGNQMKGSIYNDAGLIEATRTRLEENDALELWCAFNSEDETSFVTNFNNHPRVHIKGGMEPHSSIHFKIIDNGRKGYVSEHPFGSPERRYRMYDCSRTTNRIRKAALGHHVQRMQSIFDVEHEGA